MDANEIDSATCVGVADWCLCELIRVFHSMSLEEAQAMLDTITERQLPEIWSVLGKRRVLRRGLDYQQQVLLLLYADPDTAVPTEDLLAWLDHPRVSDFRSKVLAPLHKRRWIEWGRESETAVLSPTGIAEAEKLRPTPR